MGRDDRGDGGGRTRESTEGVKLRRGGVSKRDGVRKREVTTCLFLLVIIMICCGLFHPCLSCSSDC